MALKLVNGTSYHAETPDEVITILEKARLAGRRLRVHYGDVDTGRDWLEEFDVAGRIGRSTGSVKIPLMVASGEIGGSGLLEHCIVKIRALSSNEVLYSHPRYHTGKIELNHDPDNTWNGKTWPFTVDVDGTRHAAFKTETERTRYLNNLALAAA